jgi:hypothetical protein
VISKPFAAPPAEATDAAVKLLRRTFRGDSADSLLRFLEDRDDEPWTGDFIHATLRLCRALALRNRSDDGMLALYVGLHNVEATDPNPHRSWAAQLILAHALAADAAEIDGLASVGVDTSVYYNAGASSFNEVIHDCGIWFLETIAAALILWRWLLPEVGPADNGLLEAAGHHLHRREN